MKPFVLKQHEKDFAKLKELRRKELENIAGGMVIDDGGEKLNTATVTPHQDGGDDGKDAE